MPNIPLREVIDAAVKALVNGADRAIIRVALPPEAPTLTPKERAALTAIRDGADVFSPTTARTLRTLKRDHPDWLVICDAQGEYGPHERHPYFGAILTDEGKQAVGGAQ